MLHDRGHSSPEDLRHAEPVVNPDEQDWVESDYREDMVPGISCPSASNEAVRVRHRSMLVLPCHMSHNHGAYVFDNALQCLHPIIKKRSGVLARPWRAQASGISKCLVSKWTSNSPRARIDRVSANIWSSDD